ncbi:MAG: DUF3800 domain-containing protein [Clostridia bacterium]|nr:DUF3800 domain-containing protein [Clostridia bacterium]
MQKTISVFVDESGDFGKYDKACPYYIISMVFHNQNKAINSDLEKLDYRLSNLKQAGHVLHTGPLIRKEEVYTALSLKERMKILTAFFSLFNKLDVKYHTFIVPKTPRQNKLQLIQSLSKNIDDFISENHSLFSENKIIIYYDNGQEQVSRILASVFSRFNCDFRRVKPENYRLFQIADLITTFEMINYKKTHLSNSHSEKMFFSSINEFNRSFYKKIIKKKL